MGGGGVVRAVDGVSLTIGPGELVGLVGESGSGKSTVGNCIARLVEPTDGTIRILGTDVTHLSRREMRPLRRQVHMVFQDPYSSLNPRMTTGAIVGEPLRLHGIAKRRSLDQRVVSLFEQVGLRPELRYRFPHELSGGQRQRVGLARALSVQPSLLIADEPVSALDVSIRAQVVNLLQDLQERLGLTYLFIAHDLSVVRHISHRVAIMYAGKIVEIGDRQAIYDDPKHPYTRALLSAVPIPDPEVESRRHRIVLRGTPPDLVHPPTGCRFHGRCPIAVDRCATDPPPLEEKQPGHRAACWLT
jgi:oligopeptide/dipeptide ABC transporter ATP-binding protein